MHTGEPARRNRTVRGRRRKAARIERDGERQASRVKAGEDDRGEKHRQTKRERDRERDREREPLATEA